MPPVEPIWLPWPDWVTVLLLILLAPAAALLCWAVVLFVDGGGF